MTGPIGCRYDIVMFIWSPEAIEGLLSHPSGDVREWAIFRAIDLYPEILGEHILALLPSLPEDLSFSILRHLADRNEPIADMAPLVSLAGDEGRPKVQTLAGALLLRSGYALLPREMELTSASHYPDIVGATEGGFALVLQAYSELGAGGPILDGLADLFGFADLYGDLAEAEGKKEIRQIADYFRRIWGSKIPSLEKLRQSADILSCLEQALREPMPEERTPWKGGLLGELEHDRIRLAALFEIAKGRVHEWTKEEIGFFLACVLCLYRNRECHRRLAEADDISGLWKALLMKPWHGVPGKALEDFLLSQEPDLLLRTLSRGLTQEYSHASYAFTLTNLLGIPGRFKLFLDVLGDEDQEGFLVEEAGKALKEGGLPACQYIIEHYPQMSPRLRTLILPVLASFPTPEVVDFCLEHFEEYMCSDWPFEFVDSLGVIASPRFLPPLLKEWKEGEIRVGRTIRLISQICKVRTKQIRRVVRDVEKRKWRPGEPISLFPLRCSKCKHTYHYDLKQIYFNKNGSPIIGDVIQCKGCGSIESYEINADTLLNISAELSRILALKGEGKEVPELDTPLVLGELLHGIKVLGKKVRDVREAYHLLADAIERHPQEAGLHRRMGNLLRNGGRPDLALPYYLKAVELDPNDVDSYCSIAEVLVDQRRYGEAIPYLKRLIPLCREAKMDERLRRNIFSALLELVYIVQEKTGHRLELFPLAKGEDVKAKGPVTLYFGSVDPSDPEDFELLYYVFRHGKIPRNWSKRLERGAHRS